MRFLGMRCHVSTYPEDPGLVRPKRHVTKGRKCTRGLGSRRSDRDQNNTETEAPFLNSIRNPSGNGGLQMGLVRVIIEARELRLYHWHAEMQEI